MEAFDAYLLVPAASRVVTCDKVGRHMVALRDLMAGEVVFRERPLVVAHRQADGHQEGHEVQLNDMEAAALELMKLVGTGCEEEQSLKLLKGATITSEKLNELWDKYIVLSKSAAPRGTKEQLASMMGKASLNAHGTKDGSVALCLMGSMMEHSCDPNSFVDFGPDSDGNVIMTLRTLAPVARDENISISYVLADQSCVWRSTPLRRAMLRKQHGFVCMCNRCIKEPETARVFRFACPACENEDCLFSATRPDNECRELQCDDCESVFTLDEEQWAKLVSLPVVEANGEAIITKFGSTEGHQAAKVNGSAQNTSKLQYHEIYGLVHDGKTLDDTDCCLSMYSDIQRCGQSARSMSVLHKIESGGPDYIPGSAKDLDDASKNARPAVYPDESQTHKEKPNTFFDVLRVLQAEAQTALETDATMWLEAHSGSVNKEIDLPSASSSSSCYPVLNSSTAIPSADATSRSSVRTARSEKPISVDTLLDMEDMEAAKAFARTLHQALAQDLRGQRQRNMPHQAGAAELQWHAWIHEFVSLAPPVRDRLVEKLVCGVAALPLPRQCQALGLAIEHRFKSFEPLPSQNLTERARLSRGLRIGRSGVAALAVLEHEEIQRLGVITSDALSSSLSPVGMARVVVRLPPMRGRQLKELLVREGVLTAESAEKLFKAVRRLRLMLGAEKLDVALAGVDCAYGAGVCFARAGRASYAAATASAAAAAEAYDVAAASADAVLQIGANALHTASSGAVPMRMLSEKTFSQEDVDAEGLSRRSSRSQRRPSMPSDFI